MKLPGAFVCICENHLCQFVDNLKPPCPGTKHGRPGLSDLLTFRHFVLLSFCPFVLLSFCHFVISHINREIMKAIFIVYNQALTERVAELLDKAGARGFTQWEDVMGRGTKTGEPHMGTHTWPAMNSAVLSVVNEEKAKKLLAGVKAIEEKASRQGIRAFQWPVEEMV